MKTQEANVLKRRSDARPLWLALAMLALPIAPASAQDGNIMEAVETIERKMLDGLFEVVDTRGSRFQGDRTDRAALQFEDGSMMLAKWARAPSGAEDFNNQPRYEAAAYELQKLFLDEPDYVVPPTVVRAFPLAWYERLEPRVSPTLRNTNAVLVTLQYWLFNVTDDDVWDGGRFEADTAYARHFADLNILTYLIRHNDENVGNLLISRDPANPRVFAVDNGLAFASMMSDRGARWRNLRVKGLPRGTVERLRALTHEELTRALETVVQFRVMADGGLERVPVTANVDAGRGVRHVDDTIQIGLTEREIRDTWRRLERLVGDIEAGEYRVF
ncbi:MAG TPA: hypothetical protein VMM83_03920 [Longimicrobiales bacterium]|nr:hypothetical protein [Longimicrobiales bacterium]